MDNVATELDTPNEWWYDPTSAVIYYINNGTSAVPPPSVTFVALTRQVLINITGVTASALTFRGLRLTGAAHTFLATHGVPSVRSASSTQSDFQQPYPQHFVLLGPTLREYLCRLQGGDWTLANKAAIVAEDTEDLTFEHCTFERLDGSAMLLRGRHRGTQIRRNEFMFLGASGVAAWGRTGKRDPSDGSTIDGWDGTTGEQPRGVQFVDNLCHEIGHYQKQSSAWFQAQSCLNNISGNLMYNGPRALTLTMP
jgi:hypothetical protein